MPPLTRCQFNALCSLMTVSKTLKRLLKHRARNFLSTDAKYFTFRHRFSWTKAYTNRWMPAESQKSQLDYWVDVHLFNFASIRKSYLINKDISFVEQKIIYRMSLKQSLQYVEKCLKSRKHFVSFIVGHPLLYLFESLISTWNFSYLAHTGAELWVLCYEKMVFYRKIYDWFIYLFPYSPSLSVFMRVRYTYLITDSCAFSSTRTFSLIFSSWIQIEEMNRL